MRLLKINDYIIELDDETAIGIDVQNLDLTKPSKRLVNASNSFSIPRTINNLKAIGFIGGIPNANPAIFDNFDVTYTLNNETIINGSYVVIKEISDRIELEIIKKPTLWDEMKALNWNTFTSEYYDYLVANHNIPDGLTPISETFLQWVNRWLDASDGALRFYPSYSNEADILSLNYLTPRTKTFQLDWWNSTVYRGGHFWSDSTTLFKFIENKYNVDFDILGTHSDNPFLQNRFIKCIWNIRNFYSINGSSGWYLNRNSNPYLMQDEIDENTDGDIYGLAFAILNTYGIIIEQYGDYKYRLRDISYDIDNKIPVNTNLKLDGDEKKVAKITPSIKGYGQESIIKYTNYSDGINSVGTRKIIECNNKNIQFRKDVIKIENFIPGLKDGLLNYGVSNSFEQYKIATWEEVNDSYTWKWDKNLTIQYSEIIAKTDYKKVIPIDLSDKWQILDRALENPLYVEQRVWLTPIQYSKINNWTLYYIPELSGSYYVNKVKGYNPDKSQQSVTLELIRINNNTPK